MDTEWPPDFRVDVLFIDSSHVLGATVAELYRFVPKVAAGGVVLLHDTEWLPPGKDGVYTMTREPRGPVTVALHTYCAETKREWINHPGSCGLGEIERPNG